MYTSISLYKTMILPYIEYGDVIIDAANDKQLNKLQKIQNHCLRICLQANPRTKLIELHSRAKLNYLADRRYSHLLNIMFRRKSNPVYLDDRQIATRLHRGSLFKVGHPKTTPLLGVCNTVDQSPGILLGLRNNPLVRTLPLSIDRKLN